MVRRKLLRHLNVPVISARTRERDTSTNNSEDENKDDTNSVTSVASYWSLREKYRSIVLLVLAWCTLQLYTDSMGVLWTSFLQLQKLPSSTNKGRRAPGQLRFDWPNLQPKSKIAQLLTQQRQDCSLPLRYHYFGEGGLGAELHAYTYSMCQAHKYGWRLYGVHNMYYDQQACLDNTISQMTCYFSDLELQCPNDQDTALQQQKSLQPQDYKCDYWNLWQDKQHDDICESLVQATGVRDHIEMRSGVIEAMFTAGISPILLREAQRQHALVFPQGAPPSSKLITCHIRWGDKKSEMKLVQIQDYVEGIHKIARKQGLAHHEVHVYLATEDPAAVQAFRQAAHSSWHIYLDQFYTDMLPFRNNQTQEVAGVARNGMGHTGLLALGSLLVALEANHYILTSASNWSRLINELRRSIVKGHGCHVQEDPDCSLVIDLQVADFWMDLNEQGTGV